MIVQKKLHSCGLGIALALAVGACGDRTPQQSTYSVEIRRTSFGIPHVVAKDEAGIGYGLGYAYAQDNVCMFAEMMVTLNGERSRWFGPDAVGGPDHITGSVDVPNLQSDFFFKMLNAPEHVARAWERQRPESKALINGYVAGFNRFLSDTLAEDLPAACKRAPWVRKITEHDIIRLTRRLAAEGSSLPLMKALLAAQPPGAVQQKADDASAGEKQARTRDLDVWRERKQWLGSNAVALGKQATENGRGLLLGNPHFPWYGSLRFYQLHLTIPGKLDVMGASLGGFPVVSIGFNRHIAWSHTVNTSRHFALYALELERGDATKYVIDGQTKAMTKRTVTVDVKGADGALTQKTYDFWNSDFGLIVTLPQRLEWSAKTAYALFDPNFDNSRMVDAWYAMDQARSLDELQSAIADIVGIPWVNTIATDANGGTLYTDVTVVPNVTQTKQDACVAEPYRKLIEHGLWVLTASAACVLENVPGAPQPGIFSGKQLPMLRRTDFVQNSNDSAWMTNPAEPLTGFAPIVSAQDYPQDSRTRMGITQVLARLAGTDGLDGNRFNMRNLQQIVFNNRSYFGNLMRDDLLAVCGDSKPVAVADNGVDVKPACDAFKKWDGTANLGSTGYFVVKEWLLRLIREEEIWAVPFRANDPVNTPRGIRLRNRAALSKARAALAQAVLVAQKAGIDVNKPWGEIQYADFNGRRIPIPGGHYGDTYNLTHGAAEDGDVKVSFGTSYVQTVYFEKDGPRAEGFLTYSQSADPASAHFADQAPRFSRLQWIAQPFTDQQIEADPNYRTMTIEE